MVSSLREVEDLQIQHTMSVRKVMDDSYGLTITNKKEQIVYIDT